MAQVVHDPRDIAGGGGAVFLPLDAVYEILLRLPAQPLCRLRVVCRSWRCITTDPHFIKAHESHHRHEPPLLLVTRAGDADIYVTDFAGVTVKRVRWNSLLLVAPPRAHLGPVCLVSTPACVAVLDPAAGTVTAGLPVDYLDAIAATARRLGGPFCYEAFYSLGRLAATGEHKALRILRPSLDNRRQPHQCDVFTLGGRRRQWRHRRDPPYPVLPSGPIHDAVIGGVVFFLPDFVIPAGVDEHEPDSIWSFDLDTEEWAPAPLRGPLSSHGLLHDGGGEHDIDLRLQLCLAQVSGRLVVIRDQCWRDDNSTVDLWFLEDKEKGTWAKRCSLQKHVPPEMEDEAYPRPLLVMDDGRVVLSVKQRMRHHVGWRSRRYGGWSSRATADAVVGVVRMYDPRDGACTDVVRMERRHVVGVYTGGSVLLRLRTNEMS